MCITIHHFDGEQEINIENCEGFLTEFVKHNPSIIYYDSLPVTPHFQLPNDALVLTAMSQNNLSHSALQELWNQRNDIDVSLQVIGTEFHLVDNLFPQDAIRNILRIFLNINGIRISLASKILHKKRPKLFPIIDRRVMNIYRFPAGNDKNPEEVIKWIKHIKEDIRRNSTELEQLKNIAEGERDNISFSLVRVFDIILWQYQRQYQRENEP